MAKAQKRKAPKSTISRQVSHDLPFLLFQNKSALHFLLSAQAATVSQSTR
jgi:hypothetical protein